MNSDLKKVVIFVCCSISSIEIRSTRSSIENVTQSPVEERNSCSALMNSDEESQPATESVAETLTYVEARSDVVCLLRAREHVDDEGRQGVHEESLYPARLQQHCVMQSKQPVQGHEHRRLLRLKSFLSAY